jgi:uncharacterized LabA/DUF88 family protein
MGSQSTEKPLCNYAFIDGNNLHLSTVNLGWKLDHGKLRRFLKDKYRVEVAYYFIGYIEDYEELYSNLRKHGFELKFKEVSLDDEDNVKGNVDAEIVLQAMIDINDYSQAVIITSDGDFACLVRYLLQKGKLRKVLAASRRGCSRLLRKAAQTEIDFLDDLRSKLEYKKTEEKPYKDKTL